MKVDPSRPPIIEPRVERMANFVVDDANRIVGVGVTFTDALGIQRFEAFQLAAGFVDRTGAPVAPPDGGKTEPAPPPDDGEPEPEGASPSSDPLDPLE